MDRDASVRDNKLLLALAWARVYLSNRTVGQLKGRKNEVFGRNDAQAALASFRFLDLCACGNGWGYEVSRNSFQLFL